MILYIPEPSITFSASHDLVTVTVTCDITLHFFSFFF